MDIAAEILERLGADWLPAIYRDTVRPQRTRAYDLDVPPKENAADILHTLLGIELKVGRNRFACPDLATARYLRVFARVVPYDITRISAIADILETSWHRTLLYIADATKHDSPQARGRKRSGILRIMRDQITDIGAGGAMPAFKQSTSQRNS
jgi:hypothetical protein